MSAPAANGTRYWVAVASRDHVRRGVEGGFCQVCHGKDGPLRRMRPGDGIVYYSSRDSMDTDGAPCQSFTAIGCIRPGAVYHHAMSETFVPARRDVDFFPQAVETPIRPLIERLDFLPDKTRWGYAFRFGILEISEKDFATIAAAMQVALS